jgi:hypothetical protein
LLRPRKFSGLEKYWVYKLEDCWIRILPVLYEAGHLLKLPLILERLRRPIES